MSQSLFEYEADFIKTIKSKTGKELSEWFAIMETIEQFNNKAIRERLQKEQNLSYLFAHKLSFLFMENIEQKGPKVWFIGSRDGTQVEVEHTAGCFILEYGPKDQEDYVVILVPSGDEWEAKTGLTIKRRSFMLNFIGWKAVKQLTNGFEGSFEILNDRIIVKKNAPIDKY